jgi:O-antigen/teichoic acid export membrane protein
MGVPFLVLPVFAHLLTPTDFGFIVIVQSLLSVASTLYIFGLRNIIIREYVKEKEDGARAAIYLSGSLAITAVALLVSAALVLIFHRFLSESLGLPLIAIVLTLGAAGVGVILQYYLGILQARGQPRSFALVQNSSTALNLALSIVLLFTVANNWVGRVSGFLGAMALGGVFAFVVLIRQKQIVRVPWKVTTELFLLSAAVVPHALANSLISLSDRFYLAHRFDHVTVGLYGVAAQLSMAPFVLGTALGMATTPWWMRKLHDLKSYKDWPALRRHALLASLGLIVVTIAYFAVITAAFRYIFPPAYWPAMEYIPPLLGAALLNAIYLQCSPPIFFYKSGWILSVTGAVNLVFTITLLIVLTNYFGPIGAAYALLGSRTILLLGAIGGSAYVVRRNLAEQQEPAA